MHPFLAISLGSGVRSTRAVADEQPRGQRRPPVGPAGLKRAAWARVGGLLRRVRDARDSAGRPGPRGLLQPWRTICAGPWALFLVSAPLGAPAQPPLPPPAPLWCLRRSVPGTRPDSPPRITGRLAQTPRAGAARGARAPEVASPSFRPVEPGAGPVTDTRSSKKATRGISEAPAQLRPSAGGGLHPLPRSTEDRAGCAHLLANQKPQIPGLRRWQPFQNPGKWWGKPPVTSRRGESSPPGANERPGQSASASSSANPRRRRRSPLKLFRIRGWRWRRRPIRARWGRAPEFVGQ